MVAQCFIALHSNQKILGLILDLECGRIGNEILSQVKPHVSSLRTRYNVGIERFLRIDDSASADRSSCVDLNDEPAVGRKPDTTLPVL
ncbi:hypothetical protein EVAR_103234_1 [Eumeta japonica]|uniref:Uncharacterized protein n=1 Tax=Eumeta variegata TaxID=151549 RepID=A0A4C1X669_EUMVA|nr:hypothetical protein EVAR_103234_1 [Eumeta japonica]